MEQPDRTAALVTTDRNFARRVAIELGRYGIVVDDSAGTPLDQTPPGSLLLLAAHAAVAHFPPAALLALLKHPLTRGGQDQGRRQQAEGKAGPESYGHRVPSQRGESEFVAGHDYEGCAGGLQL